MQYVEISSKYSRRRDTMDRERIAARRLRKRMHPKRHGVGEEQSQIDRRKHARAVKRRKKRLDARQAYVAQVRLYWQGLGDHP
jgi:hypothetical protein